MPPPRPRGQQTKRGAGERCERPQTRRSARRAPPHNWHFAGPRAATEAAITPHTNTPLAAIEGTMAAPGPALLTVLVTCWVKPSGENARRSKLDHVCGCTATWWPGRRWLAYRPRQEPAETAAWIQVFLL